MTSVPEKSAPAATLKPGAIGFVSSMVIGLASTSPACGATGSSGRSPPINGRSAAGTTARCPASCSRSPGQSSWAGSTTRRPG